MELVLFHYVVHQMDELHFDISWEEAVIQIGGNASAGSVLLVRRPRPYIALPCRVFSLFLF